VAPPGGYAGPPRPAQGVAYRPAAAHSAVSAATYAYRNQFSEVSAGVDVQETCNVRSYCSMDMVGSARLSMFLHSSRTNACIASSAAIIMNALMLFGWVPETVQAKVFSKQVFRGLYPATLTVVGALQIQALRRGVAEEVCRLLLLVSQEEGALLARQHPALLAQAVGPGGGAGGSSPAAGAAPGLTSGAAPVAAPQAGAAAAAPAASAAPGPFSQPAHLPVAPGPVLNGPGPIDGAIAQQSPAQAAAPTQPTPVSAPAVAGPSAQSPATPAAVGLPATAPGLPPGVAANGAYQRAVHAANQQVRRLCSSIKFNESSPVVAE